MALFKKQPRHLPPPPPTPPPSNVPPPPVAEPEPIVSLAHLPSAPPGQQLAWSPLVLDPSSAEHVWGETIRILGDDDDAWEQTESLDRELRNATGSGLQRHVMAGEDRTVLSDAYNAREIVVDPVSGALAVAAGLSHWSFGLGGALDAGLRDGRNMFTWLEEHPVCLQLEPLSPYLGNVRTGRLEMSVFAGAVGGMALDPRAERLATIEWRGHHDQLDSPGFVFEDDLSTGRRRLLGVLQGFSGRAPVSYSPDSTWLLVGPTTLLRPEDGARLTLPQAMATAWAPAFGASSLLQVRGSAEEGFRFVVVDLAGGGEEDLGPLEVNADDLVLYLVDLDVHPTGTKALVTSPHGFPGPYRDGEGARAKAQVLDLESRTITPLTSPTIPGFPKAEREQDRPRWVADRRGAAVTVGDHFLSQLEPRTGPATAPDGFVSDLALSVLQLCATSLEPNNPSRNPARVRVETIRTMAAVIEADPARGRQIVAQLRDFTFPMAMQALGPIDPARGIDLSQRPMVFLDIGLQMLAEDRYDTYDWNTKAYLQG